MEEHNITKTHGLCMYEGLGDSFATGLNEGFYIVSEGRWSDADCRTSDKVDELSQIEHLRELMKDQSLGKHVARDLSALGKKLQEGGSLEGAQGLQERIVEFKGMVKTIQLWANCDPLSPLDVELQTISEMPEELLELLELLDECKRYLQPQDDFDGCPIASLLDNLQLRAYSNWSSVASLFDNTSATILEQLKLQNDCVEQLNRHEEMVSTTSIYFGGPSFNSNPHF